MQRYSIIHTRKLHDAINDESCKLIQFADDFNIIVKAKNLQSLITKATEKLTQFNNELKKLNLIINLAKTNTIIFNHKIDIFTNYDILLGNCTIKNVNQVKILGIIIDNKLNFTINSKSLKANCNKYLNLLKVFSKTKGGAHPLTMLQINNALINSRILYNTIVSNISKKNNNIIQVIQNQALRICMGYIKTTPINVILTETCKLPFIIQDELATAKFLTKQIYYDNTLSDKIKTNQLYRKFEKTIDQYDLKKLIPIKISHTDYKTPENLKIIYSNVYNLSTAEKLRYVHNIYQELNKIPDTPMIFADGSKTLSKNGLGIYFDRTGETISMEISPRQSIKSLETLAILIALQTSKTTNNTNIVIFTDSKSSLQSINKTIEKNGYKYYENKIINAIKANNNINYVLYWIPAHIGFTQHDLADQAAKEAKVNINVQHIPPEETMVNIKTDIEEYWRNTYIESDTQKGLFYRNIINNNPKRKPWFVDSNLNSSQIKTINRLRSGHCFDKKTLAILKIVNNNICEICNEVEAAEHIIKKCTKYSTIRTRYNTITNIQYKNLLQDKRFHIFITEFLNEIEYYL